MPGPRRARTGRDLTNALPSPEAGSGSSPGLPLSQEQVVAAPGQVPVDALSLLVVDQGSCEAALVHGGVVVTAEQRGVVQVGRAEVCPVDQVMGLTPVRRRRAGREGASPIAQPQPLRLGGRE